MEFNDPWPPELIDRFNTNRLIVLKRQASALGLEKKLRQDEISRRNDNDIFIDVRQALIDLEPVRADVLKFSINDGWITLQGEVDWEYQRRAIISRVLFIVGVAGIVNDIHIKNPPMLFAGINN
ncbi:BON domain-containing protein [Cellvibrio sp. KY-GH-1]|uniref:BON domain-containing protein n=1 Tax=Cellvibrio sp. KY-GH-1 TaxID=2303332 RepID=UPI0012467CC7|nr:BON domain-containing protein [Cellvibrio sp. KY-GH-1]QEY18261.1 BON domain-containing protein [Cellvibrio sp. KY-GH-1]